ncbi:double-stranded RNA-binding domain-containing protein loquacious isoform X2 [Oratosquilla oratoria]|uniref:double-stranded RNA-binding domain-containing protein loquacious isoform X2 n=1 Tax=Oratosquilla oratoria TaxID=337810 RepID=UPI003F758984
MYHHPPPNVDSTSPMEQISALPSKTPVSLLQELCMRRGISPKYDLLQIEGAVHEPTFVYRVTVGEFAANGSGQSKKKAKHAAAKAVLDIIIQGGAGTPSTGQPGSSSDLSNQIVSPYDDGIPGNPVGSLQELCMARRWPPPTYELVAEEGFPHERSFSIACTIGKTKEIGTGKSKKLAKRQAAYKMQQKLKDQPVEQPQVNVLADDDDEIAQKLAARYSGLKDSKVMSLTTSHSQKVSQFHKNLKQSPGKKLQELQTITLSSVSLDFTQLLQDLAQEANFEVTYVDIEEKSVTGQHQCLVQLSTLPVAVCYGTGSSVNEAQTQASHNALEYLKIMTKK